jgi:uncharacterized protein YceH (UPF0502 family)
MAERPTLTQEELRVLGCLMENDLMNQSTDPMTTKAILSACNQSINRDPVVEYPETKIQNALDMLVARGLVESVQDESNPVPRFQHLAAPFFGITIQEQAILCALLLRGPLTLEELFHAACLLCPYDDLDDLIEVLHALSIHVAPIVSTFPPASGETEGRYWHLLTYQRTGNTRRPIPNEEGEGRSSVRSASPKDATIQELRLKIRRLERIIEAQAEEIESLKKD